MRTSFASTVVRRNRRLLGITCVLALTVTAGCEKPVWHGQESSASAPHAAAPTPSAVAPSSAAGKHTKQPVDPVRPLHRRTYSIVVDDDLVHTGTTAGVVSWDFADQSKPERLASLVLQGSVQRLTKLPESSLLAVTTGPTGLAIVDTSAAKQGKLTLVNQHPWASEARRACYAAWALVPGARGTGFLACGGSGVARVDLSEPANPSIEQHFSVDGYVRDVAILDEQSGVSKPAVPSRTVAAAAGLRGLVIVDFVGPKPKSLAQVDVGGEARALAVNNGHVYVAAGAAGLVIVDVRKPEQPAVVGSLLPKTTDMARGITMSGTYALLCLGDSGLAVVDVSNPETPREIGRFDPEPALNRVTVSGQKLFAANDADGVAILDISKPAHPTQLYPSPKHPDKTGE